MFNDTFDAVTLYCAYSLKVTIKLQQINNALTSLPYYSVFAAVPLHYFTLSLTYDPVTLTFDLEHLQCIACDVLKLCTKFECNRTIRGRVKRSYCDFSV